MAFIYDTDGHLIAEHNASSGAMQREYIWIGDQMAGIVDNSSGTPTLDAVTTGQIEEPLLVTAADQSLLFDGYVDPYGNQGTLATTSYTMNMRLPGQYFQAGSGLSQNGWRDYDPTIGRYIEGDPIGIDGGQNVYAYVDGDPLNLIDFFGLDLTPAQQQAIAAAARDWSQSNVPYLFGGDTKAGADCSGSISSIYNQAGVPIGRITSQSIKDDPLFGPVVGPPQLGDIGVYPGHVDLYGGNTGPAKDVWSATHTGGKPFGPANSSWFGSPKWHRYKGTVECKCSGYSSNAK